MSTKVDRAAGAASVLRRGWKHHHLLFSCLGAAAVTLGVVRMSATPANEGTSASAIRNLSTAATGKSELPAAAGAIEGELAIHFCKLLLSDAQRSLSRVDTMQAVFHKRERIDGELQELNIMDMKARRQPAAVYMLFRQPDEGREIIWRADADDAKMLVHPGGWRRKLVPLLRIDPTGEQAMQYSRRPIGDASIWSFTEQLLLMVEKDLAADQSVRVTLSPNEKLGDRPCYCFRFAHDEPSTPFAHASLFIDRASSIPLAIERFNWPAQGSEQTEPVLEESYVYNELTLGAPLTDLDFSVDNPAYLYNGR